MKAEPLFRGHMKTEKSPFWSHGKAALLTHTANAGVTGFFKRIPKTCSANEKKPKRINNHKTPTFFKEVCSKQWLLQKRGIISYEKKTLSERPKTYR